MLLVKVRLDGHTTVVALAKVSLFIALGKLVLVIGAHFYDLCARRAVGQHLTLKHVVEVHFLCTRKLGRRDPTELACATCSIPIGGVFALFTLQGRRLLKTASFFSCSSQAKQVC